MSIYVRAIDGMTNHTAADLRAAIADFIVAAGVLNVSGGDLAVTENGTPNMSVNVAPGIAYVLNASWTATSSDQKLWDVLVDAIVNVAISSNPSGSTRYDLICVKVDTGVSPNASASDVATVISYEGTPGAGIPATPNNYLKIAEVEVINGATTIITAKITDRRVQVGLKFANKIVDSNGKDAILASGSTIPVNQLTATNADAGGTPALSSTGSDINISLEINPKGTGVVKSKTTVQLTPYSVDVFHTVSDGKVGFDIPIELNGFNLVSVRGSVDTAGITGTADFQIRRVRSGTPADMLSTKITIDSNEISTSTAATPAVINTSNDDVVTGDMIYVDQDAIHSGTAAKGGHISLTFAKP
jgi:hypothetical protein